MTPSVTYPLSLQQPARASAAEMPAPGRLSVLMATTDPEIRQSLTELLEECQVTAVWANSIAEVKSAIERGEVSACFCGFWLVDGTYRDVISHLKRRNTEVPVIIVCAPTCPQEYKDYLASLNIRVFDFICHPYRRDDLERILASATGTRKTALPAPAEGPRIPKSLRGAPGSAPGQLAHRGAFASPELSIVSIFAATLPASGFACRRINLIRWYTPQ